MKKVLVIFNPMAGNKKFLDLEKLVRKDLKAGGFEGEWYRTEAIRRQNFEKFLKGKYERIVVIGGDGTVAEVASFMIRNKVRVPLGIVAVGSANLLAMSLGLPVFNVKQALKLALSGKGVAVGAMRINRHNYGLIATGSGYDTFVMHMTTRSMKRWLGFFAYAWMGVRTFFFYKAKPFKITVDGKRHTLMAKTVMVFNMIPFGDWKLTQKILGKKVSARDGVLEVFAVNPRSLWDLFRIKSKITSFKGKKISIKSKREKTFQIDGDLFKKRSVIDVSVVKNAIKIIQ